MYHIGIGKRGMMDDIKALVELGEDLVRQGMAECKKWHLTHENCDTCPYELGCSKSVRIGLTILASNEYNGDIIQETIDKLLSSKTVREVKDIHIPEMAY